MAKSAFLFWPKLNKPLKSGDDWSTLAALYGIAASFIAAFMTFNMSEEGREQVKEFRLQDQQREDDYRREDQQREDRRERREDDYRREDQRREDRRERREDRYRREDQLSELKRRWWLHSPEEEMRLRHYIVESYKDELEGGLLYVAEVVLPSKTVTEGETRIPDDIEKIGNDTVNITVHNQEEKLPKSKRALSDIKRKIRNLPEKRQPFVTY